MPVLVFVCAYSYTKRFTSLAHFWLGASLLLAPLGAWIAIRGFEQIEIAFVQGLAVLFWVAGFDILYACQDVDFDKKAGLFSVPARLGIPTSLRIALACHVLMLGMLFLLWWIARDYLGVIYLAGVAAIAWPPLARCRSMSCIYTALSVQITKLDHRSHSRGSSTRLTKPRPTSRRRSLRIDMMTSWP